MTYFLTGQDTEVPITTPDVKPATWFQGLGAATESMMRRSDGFYGEKHTRDFVTIEKMDPILRKVGIDALNEYYTANDAGYDHLRPAPENVDDFVAMHGDRAWDMVSEVAKAQAAADPDAWAGVDLSGEDITAETNQRLQDDQADADAILNSMPSGRGMAELVGGMVGMVADPRNVPFLLAGGGSGSLLSIMGREALLNVTAEAVTLPSRFKMADILEEPDPDVAETLLMAAGAGAVFGGAVEGLSRALHYFRGRSEVRTALPGLSKQDSDLVITAVEDALVKGADPIEAMSRAMRETAPVVPQRAPLILDESLAVSPEPTALAPASITEMPLPVTPGVQATTDQIVATAKSGIAKAGKKEVLGWLKRQGVDLQGWLGTELKARGLTHKSFPGLFKKGGLRDIDNIVADELDPAISWKIERAADGTYLDRDSILRALDEEIGPKSGYGRDYDPRRAYADPDPEDRGWMVNDLEARKFAEPERWQEVLAQDFDAYLASTGRTLLPREREEIIGILSTRGGDAEDLVYSAMSREIDEAEMALLSGTRGEGDGRSDVPWGDEAGVGQVPDRPSGSPAGQSQTPARNAPESGTGGIQPQVERTAAGDQYVAPGIAATTERQRLEARQNARLQGGNRAADEGLFDVASRGQMDMFSDPASKEARVVQDAIIADFRDQIAKGEDVTVDLGDGKGPRTMSAIIKDMEADEAFVARLDLCGLMGGPTE